MFCYCGRLARTRRASRKATPLSALYFTVFPCANEVRWPSTRAWYLVVLGTTRGWVRTWRVNLSASLLPGPLGQSHGESWACSHTWHFSLAARAELVVSPRAWYLAVRVAMSRMRRIMVAVRSEGSRLGSLSQSSKATPMGLRVDVFMDVIRLGVPQCPCSALLGRAGRCTRG